MHLLLPFLWCCSCPDDIRKFYRQAKYDCKKLVHTQLTRTCSLGGLEESTALLPVINSNKKTPKLYTSVFTVSCPVLMYSGAQYPYVPITRVEMCVFPPTGPSFASPKSESLGLYSSSRRMLGDLRSR